MKEQTGFTLVEVLVTGVLSTIVAGSLVTTLTLVNRQIQSGVQENRLGRIQTVVSEQIRSSARKSWGFLQQSDQIDPNNVWIPLGPIANTREIILGYYDGRPQAKYLIDNSGVLMEWHDGDAGDYYPFKIGEETVHLAPAKSSFSLVAGRKSMTFNLAYVLGEDTLPVIAETIICRNLSN